MADLRRHSVDRYHVAAKAAAAAGAVNGSMSTAGGSTSPAPLHAWAYSTPPKTPNNLPAPIFHPLAPHPHKRASTVDYFQLPYRRQQRCREWEYQQLWNPSQASRIQNTHAFMMQHLIADLRLTAAAATGAVPLQQQKPTAVTEQVADFDMSSIATATEAVKASTTATFATVTDVSKSTLGQKEEKDAAVGAEGAEGADADVEMSLNSSMDNIVPETKRKDREEEDEPAQEEEELKAVAEEETESTSEYSERDTKEEEEGEEEVEGPLSAAEAFAKSLTAVTTILDPAATQLMDQLRLQDYLRVLTPLPLGASSTSTLSESKK
ncbi:hypothetical protein BGW39_003314 [Mortierella sp. 14UC]|nr:hypothetical protein BGW39_003314 [Mortierella sp. 14UC]